MHSAGLLSVPGFHQGRSLSSLQDSTSCSECLELIFASTSYNVSQGDNAVKKKSQPAVIFCIWFWGAANELHNLSSEEGKKKKKEKRAYETFLAAPSNYFRKMQGKVKCLKMGIFDICPFISLKFYQQLFHVLTSCVNRAVGRKKALRQTQVTAQPQSSEQPLFGRGMQVWSPWEVE